MNNKTYIAIDLKSFYASVEAMERGLDPMTTNLLVADLSRTEKTICLAVSPSLKAYGISGRARMFEVIQQVKNVNSERLRKAPGKRFIGSSFDDNELKANPNLSIDYVVAVPRMALYIEYSTRVYDVYLKYVAPEDIHVYSIDEVFIDATAYLKTLNMSAHDFTRMLIKDVLATTGVTATAGIGTNLYLCKVAMDITAKHITNKQTGIHYTIHGDYYLPDLKLPESKDNRPIGKWGRLHLNHLKKHCKSTYYTYLMNGTLHDYLCSINDQAEDMFNRIVSHMAEADGTDEKLKATDQMKWVGLMNNYRHCAEEVVFDSIIYT